MAQEIIIESECATLVYHTDTKIVHHKFHRPIGGQDFRSILDAGTDLLQKHQATKWLSDDRENSALSRDDTEWSMSNWFPRTIQAGWKYWALVVPAGMMARLNMKEFVDSYYEQGLRIMVFVDPQEALEWLERQ